MGAVDRTRSAAAAGHNTASRANVGLRMEKRVKMQWASKKENDQSVLTQKITSIQIFRIHGHHRILLHKWCIGDSCMFYSTPYGTIRSLTLYSYTSGSSYSDTRKRGANPKSEATLSFHAHFGDGIVTNKACMQFTKASLRLLLSYSSHRGHPQIVMAEETRQPERHSRRQVAGFVLVQATSVTRCIYIRRALAVRRVIGVVHARTLYNCAREPPQ